MSAGERGPKALGERRQQPQSFETPPAGSPTGSPGACEQRLPPEKAARAGQRAAEEKLGEYLILNNPPRCGAGTPTPPSRLQEASCRQDPASPWMLLAFTRWAQSIRTSFGMSSTVWPCRRGRQRQQPPRGTRKTTRGKKKPRGEALRARPALPHPAFYGFWEFFCGVFKEKLEATRVICALLSPKGLQQLV